MLPTETPAPNPSNSASASVLDWISRHFPAVGAVFGVVLGVAVLVGFLKPMWGPIFGQVGRLVRHVLTRDRAASDEIRRRQLFAASMESRLNLIGDRENWRDARFSELEAEIELEHGPGRKRVRSLSKALGATSERLVLLQGEPGAGKSVVLRHLALRIARRATRMNNPKSVIPIYVNLKEFRRTGDEPIDARAIRDFVLGSIKRSRVPDVDEFLDAQFDRGMREGSWLFLFDSFDEIPDILVATEVEGVVEEYAVALYDFLHTMNASRGVIASREFKGPRAFGWPTYRIRRLTTRQKRRLIKQAKLTPLQESLLLSGLGGPHGLLGEFSDSPLLLGMLADYVRRNDELPVASHQVFDDFVDARLRRDGDMVQLRFGLSTSEVRAAAERAAFCMASLPGVGLAPPRSRLVAVVTDRFGPIPGLERCLDALLQVRLAAGSVENEFSFAHRRFQEFFATALVLSGGDTVTPKQLLREGQWRETAVTMLQTQSDAAVAELVRAAEAHLRTALRRGPSTAEFAWPRGSLHILSVLAAGLNEQTVSRLQPRLRELVGSLLTYADERGLRHDRKWAIDAVIVAEPECRDDLLDRASGSTSPMLREAALYQIGRFRNVPPRLARHVRRVLIGQAGTLRLWRERASIEAGLRHLREPASFVRLMWVLWLTPIVELAAFAAFVTAASVRGFPVGRLVLEASGAVAVLCLTFSAFCTGLAATPTQSWTMRGERYLRVIPGWRSVALGMLAALHAITLVFLSRWLLGYFRPLPFFLVLYLGLCIPAYIVGAARARAMPLRCLPIAPLWMIVVTIGKLRSVRYTEIFKVAGAGVLALALVGGMSVALIWSINWVQRNFGGFPASWEQFLRAYLSYVAVGLLAVAVAVQLWAIFGSRRRDRRLVTVTATGAEISLSVMQELLSRLKTDSGLYHLVHHLRRGTFVASPAAVDHLKVIEHHGRPCPYTVHASENTLDEIARLLAQRRGAA